MNFETSRL